MPRPDHDDSAVGSARVGGSRRTAFVAFAALALINMQSGLHGDPRTVNPTPADPPYPPFLGVTNWPLVTSVTSVLLTLGFFGVVIRWSIRQRSPHWPLIVGIAALFAGALDPLANWATFTVFDPRVAHFPLSWPYFNASPPLGTDSVVPRRLRELLRADRPRPAIDSSSLHRTAAPRRRLVGRHRLASVFVTGFIAGLPLNALMQFMWLKVGLFVYTQAAGPVLHSRPATPAADDRYDSVLFAIVALLCVRDDSGRPAVVPSSRRCPGAWAGPSDPARLIVVATAVLMTAVAVPIAVFSLLRIGGHPEPAYDQCPYPTVKVYDPYGHLEQAGKPARSIGDHRRRIRTQEQDDHDSRFETRSGVGDGRSASSPATDDP